MRPGSPRAIVAVCIAVLLLALIAMGTAKLLGMGLVGLAAAALIMSGGAVGIALAIGRRTQARLQIRIEARMKVRMKAMQHTIDAVSAGDPHRRVPRDGTDSAFDRQAAALNRMLDRIDERMAGVRHAARDVTHELKSPLARLRAKIAALARRSADDPLGPDIADLLEQTDRILDLFASLLRLWEIEGGQRRDRFADIDLAALVAEVGEGLQGVAEEAGQVLELDAVQLEPIRGDINLLRQMLVNLVENAIRHTPTGTRIMLRAEWRAEGVALIVADNGPGIPAARHATAIRRFGRLEAAEGPDGQGLGLTLVDAIARLHHGRLMLEDARPGLRAVVVLPLRPGKTDRP